jgi:FKBP-type peptidyl-prolyl cis-trans isomerase (trigger factor)
MQQVLEANPFEVPPSLVEQYLDSLLQAPEDADPDELATAKEQARPAAEYGVRRMLVIERIAEMEGLHATQEDLELRVQEIAEQNGVDASQVRRELAQVRPDPGHGLGPHGEAGVRLPEVAVNDHNGRQLAP